MMSTELFKIRLQSPAEAAAFVPYLLGFHPTTSLVVLALDGQHVLCTVRVDLPTTPADDDRFRASCQTLARHLARCNTGVTVMLGYGDMPTVEHAAEIARTQLSHHGIGVDGVLHVHDGRARNLGCTDPQCCPPQGTPIDATGTAAASAVYAGLTAAPDRAALAAQLQPLTGARRAALTAATAAAWQTLIALVEAATDDVDRDPQPGGDRALALTDLVLKAQATTLLDDALKLYQTGHTLDDERAAMLSVLVAFPTITDIAVRCTSNEPWQIDMWVDLLRRAEPPFTAACAAVLAFCALQAGKGALAQLAVDRALQDDPGHALARRLQQLVQTGVDPDTAARIARS